MLHSALRFANQVISRWSGAESALARGCWNHPAGLPQKSLARCTLLRSDSPPDPELLEIVWAQVK
jgi:hypothetical protein